MPTYQYACTECGDQSEVVQRFSDDPLTVCGVCGGRLRKVYSAVGIVFKGSGFYRTDSRAGSKSGASSNGKSGESSDGSKTESGAKAESGSKSGSDSSSSNGSSGDSSSKSESKSGSGSAKKSGADSKVA
ncbi:MAG: FmdB family zinc ribbon protein [Streptosporangiaceae bacterium]